VLTEIGARTDLGCLRELNEDNFRVVPELDLLVLSDGMGGAAHGEVASRIAVDVVVEHCQKGMETTSLSFEGGQRSDLSYKTNRLASAIRRANRVIHEAANADPELRGMGATIVAVWLDGEKFSLAHVGDSRAYRLRADALELLTRDHSLVAEQVRLGLLTQEQADQSEYQTVLIRALGTKEFVEVDVDEHLLLNGDSVLLCSDGLSRMISDEVIGRTIVNSDKMQKAADRLVELAKEAGGLDNITVILLHAKARPRSLLNRIFARRNR
jgi:serine/threonine protein phosphatase PrpC